MTRVFNAILLSLPLWLVSLGPGHADAWSDALEAYGREDYAAAERHLTPLAENGDPMAQYLLGIVYWNGIDNQTDTVAALKWLMAAAESGSRLAQFELGSIFEEGDRVKRDVKRALDYFRQAATNEKPHEGAAARVAALEKELSQFSGSMAEAEREDEKADSDAADEEAAEEVAEAMRLAGAECDRLMSHEWDEFARAEPVRTAKEAKANAPRAIEACSGALKSGESRHIFQLGRAYKALGDDARGLEAYKAAADQGHYYAAYLYGLLHLNGTGGAPKDGRTAREYLRMATGASNRLMGPALFELGHSYLFDLPGVESDENRAGELFQACHEIGSDNNSSYGRCTLAMGRCHETGCSGTVDKEKALGIYQDLMDETANKDPATFALVVPRFFNLKTQMKK